MFCLQALQASFQSHVATFIAHKVIWPQEHHSAIIYWVKVRYDGGIMHVKVRELISMVGGKKLSLMEYQIGKAIEDDLPSF